MNLRMVYMFIAFLCIQTVSAKDYYVDATLGDDSYNGQSSTLAWKSLKKVSSIFFRPGDRILLKRGEQWKGAIILQKGGNAGNPLKILAYGSGQRPIIDASNQRAGLSIDHRSYVEIRDLKIINGNMGISISDVKNISFEDIVVDNCMMGFFSGGVENVVIKNSKIVNSTQSHGLYISGPSAQIIVEFSIFSHNAKSGIHFNCSSTAKGVKNAVVRYNQIYGNEYYGIMNTATENSEFYYNLIYDNLGYGLQFEYDTHASGFAPNKNKVYNNIFYNNSGPSIYFGAGTNENIVKNNIFHQGTQNMYLISVKPSDRSNNFSNNLYYGSIYSSLWLKNGSLYSSYSQWASVSGDQNSISQEDPVFTNLSASDFTLKSNSPAVGKGVNVGLTIDFAGKPVSGSPNIGAYQSEIVNSDNIPPSLVSASINSATSVILTFSEKINSSDAVNIANYSINNGVNIFSASLASNGLNVTLTTSTNSPGQTNTITVKNIRDLAGNLINPNNRGQYTVPTTDIIPVNFIVINVTASSQVYMDKGPENTIDNKLATFWTGTPFPSSIVYDLGISKLVSQTKFSFYAFSKGRIYNYTIALSTDGKNWKNVVNNELSASKRWTINDFDPTAARYIKLIMNSANTTALWATLYEAEISGIDQLPKQKEEENPVKTLPLTFNLMQNFPNPFNPITQISFTLPAADFVSLKIYDMLGKEVAVLVNEYKPEGRYTINFNAAHLASGIYLYRLMGQKFVQTKKMILQK